MFQQLTNRCTPGNCRGDGVNEGEGACRGDGYGEEQKSKRKRVRSRVWAERAGEVRVMTGTHAGLYLPDVWSVHTVLSSAPISFLSHYVLDPTLHQSLFLTHSLPLFLPITGPWKKKIGQPLCKEERRSGEGGRLWAEGKKQGETKHSG